MPFVVQVCYFLHLQHLKKILIMNLKIYTQTYLNKVFDVLMLFRNYSSPSKLHQSLDLLEHIQLICFLFYKYEQLFHIPQWPNYIFLLLYIALLNPYKQIIIVFDFFHFSPFLYVSVVLKKYTIEIFKIYIDRTYFVLPL